MCKFILLKRKLNIIMENQLSIFSSERRVDEREFENDKICESTVEANPDFIELKNSKERSVGEDQIAVAGEGKLEDNRFDGGAAEVKDEFLGTKCREIIFI